jgi:hypothetical protein
MSAFDGAMSSAMAGIFPSSEVRMMGMLLQHSRQVQDLEVEKVKATAEAAVQGEARKALVETLRAKMTRLPVSSKEYGEAEATLLKLAGL